MWAQNYYWTRRAQLEQMRTHAYPYAKKSCSIHLTRFLYPSNCATFQRGRDCVRYSPDNGWDGLYEPIRLNTPKKKTPLCCIPLYDFFQNIFRCNKFLASYAQEEDKHTCESLCEVSVKTAMQKIKKIKWPYFYFSLNSATRKCTKICWAAVFRRVRILVGRAY